MKITKNRLRQIIKEELTKHINEYQDPSLNDKQKQVIDLIMRDKDGLIDLVYELGKSDRNPRLLGAYRQLIKAIAATGIRPEALI